MKGLEKLREKLPDYQGKSLLKFMIVAIIVFFSSLTFQLIMDSIPRLFTEITFFQVLAPLTPIFGSIFVLIIGFSMVYSFWRNKDRYLVKFSEKAYQKAFKFVVTGVPMVITVVIHNFFPTDFLIPYENNQDLSWYLGTPIFDVFFPFSLVIFWIRLTLSFLFLGLGMTIAAKTLKIFDIDYMGLVYVYYPEESTLQNHEIFSILRHPTYHGLMLISIGSIFLRFSIYSIIYFLLFLIGINIHVKFVEERELIKRFGDSYKVYKQNVPAFFVRLKDLKKYLSFVF
jgi:protein-S-isoprenylcysteine O-methyltransferase Ste14